MSRRVAYGLIVVGVLAILGGVLLWQTRGLPREPAPTSPRVTHETIPQPSSAKSSADRDSATSRVVAEIRSPGPTRDRRAELLGALARARAQREARGGASGRPDTARGGDPVFEPLALENKTGSNQEWERRQIQTLNQLLAECYHLSATEDPPLAGKVGLLFTITGEPEIGGLVEEVAFDAAYTTLDQPELLECLRESVYALELDPPPTGVRAARQVTLVFTAD